MIMGREQIPQFTKDKVLQIVSQYNASFNTEYRMEFKRIYAYLERKDKNGMITIIGRLKYMPKRKNWDFAVFKYSRERYDPDEMLFPGRHLLDGTIEGVLKAGHEIYPDR